MNGKLIISEGGRDQIHEICEDVTRVGRDPSSHIRVKEQAAAAHHCEIRLTPQGFKLVDLESSLGTSVNGKPVNQHLLRNGDSFAVGQSKFTYLGDSAPKAGTPSRPEPMRSLPIGDDGEPRRFYRHEGSRRRGNPAVVAFAIIGVCAAAGLVIWALSSADYGDADEKEFYEAVHLGENGDEKSLAAAVDRLSKIPENKKFGSKLVKDVIFDMKADLTRLRADQLKREADQFYSETMNHFRAHPEEDGYLRIRTKNFVEKWPTDPRREELERLLEVAELGGPEKEAEWRNAEAAIRQALQRQDFRQAFAEHAKVAADPKLSKVFAPKLAKYRSTLEAEFAAFYDRRSAAALDAKAKGDAAGAIRIFTELAEVGCEPKSSEARRLLEKLK